MAEIIPAVTKLTNRVIRILGCNPGVMTLQGTNTYLIGTGQNRILLDTGDKDVKKYQHNLAEVLKQEQADIKHIIISHWHHDHFGGVEDLYGTIAIDTKVWKHKRSRKDDPDEPPAGIPVNWLTDGQELTVDGATVTVHHTPGHTTDHVVLTLFEEFSLFSGDCILGEGTAVFEDLYSYMSSLKTILDLRPYVIYPGHGSIIKEPSKIIDYYINHRIQREAQILKALKSNKSAHLNAMELVHEIYTETPEHLWPAAALNVTHHLKKLTKEKKIVSTKIDGESKWRYAET